VLGNLNVNFPKGTIGFDSSEDCAVYPINEDTLILQSVDFFTPIVDDPFTFGQIAATNSLSDIYAMGGKPIYALNIAEFPSDEIPLSVLSEIMEGGLNIANKAQIPILGGHTIKDKVPKYGLVVTGEVNKKNLTLNSKAKAGDVLILTKPIGTGIISTALKNNEAPEFIVNKSINVMTQLNNLASKAMIEIGVNACTDVTGYGLLGHLLEMCQASNVSATINFNATPIIEGTYELAQKGHIPGGTKKNLDFVSQHVNFSKNISNEQKYILSDAQTSGGLLISVSTEKSNDLLRLLKEQNIKCSLIGKIYNQAEFSIYID